MRKTWTGVAVLFGVSALLLWGCGGGTVVGNPPSSGGGDSAAPADVLEVKSEVPRASAETGADLAASADEQAFAWSFFARLAPSENLAFSPYSITAALAMTSAGAKGTTLSQLRSALHFSAEGDAFHAGQNALSLALASRNREAITQAGGQAGVQVLHSSNDLWLLPALRPPTAFLDTLAADYGAGVHLAPFDLAPEDARLAINRKVASDTNGLIDPLLAEGDIGTLTRFVLTNALYFKAGWQTPFAKVATQLHPFHTLDDSALDVSMMQVEQELPYAAGNGFEAVTLPYAGGEVEMLLIVPQLGQFERVRAALNAQFVSGLVAGLERRSVSLGLPRFSVSFRAPLKEKLKEAGMIDAFDPALADFSGIAAGVYVDDVVHMAKVTVDEEGTEAAAATAVVGAGTSAPTTAPLPLTIDRPFVFVIRDVPTGAALFVGQVVRP
jgi:serpin B